MSLTDIFLDGVLVDVDVSFWSGAKALTAEDLGLQDEDIADAYKLGKKMLVPAEVIREFRHIESKARRTVEGNSFPFPIGNARFVPKKKFDEVLNTLKECQVNYYELANKLVENYEQYREQMIPVYKEAAENAFIQQIPAGIQTFSMEDREDRKQQFVEQFLQRIRSYYPTAEQARAKFSLNWNLYEITFPRGMDEADGEELALNAEKRRIAEAEYRAQIREKMSGFVSEVVSGLRQEAVEICNRIIGNIQDGKIIKGQTTNSLRNFVDRFKDLNFVGDTQVEQQLESLKKEFLEVHTPEEIRENEDIREEFKRRLHELSDVASNMTDISNITGQYKRKITWNEEE